MKFVYKGKASESLGRFGSVRPGEVLDLTIAEYYYHLKNPSPDYQLVEGQIAEELGSPSPAPTAEFDLTRLEWSSPTLWKQLKARYSKLSLLKIALAMKNMGVDIETSIADQKDDILDRIVETYLSLGWQFFGLTPPDEGSRVEAVEATTKKRKRPSL